VDLMSIGEFAGLSRLSAKALRLYDELGLLPPARVDPGSGYRWYAAGQLDSARLVASLRQVGVPLAQIRLILSLEPEAAAAQPTPRVDGVAGAAFLIYYGEVNQDSDGPVEFCWPVPPDLAGQLAASFPALTLRTEPAHQEACIHLREDPQTAAQPQLLDESFRAWAAEQQRQPSDLPVRVTLLTTAAPVTDASRHGGSDFAVPLRDRAGAA
jgi:DNA-binding transcriptional MerR regulator